MKKLIGILLLLLLALMSLSLAVTVGFFGIYGFAATFTGFAVLADILVVAAGKAGMVGAESVREGQVVLDVGIHVGADGALCGDTRFAEVEPVVAAITPVPGGVGTVTSTILASHVVEAAERAAKK